MLSFPGDVSTKGTNALVSAVQGFQVIGVTIMRRFTSLGAFIPFPLAHWRLRPRRRQWRRAARPDQDCANIADGGGAPEMRGSGQAGRPDCDAGDDATAPTEVPASAEATQASEWKPSSSPVRACAATSATAPTRSPSSTRRRSREGKLNTAEVLQSLRSLPVRPRSPRPFRPTSSSTAVRASRRCRSAASVPTVPWCCSMAAAPARRASVAAFRRSTSTSFRSSHPADRHPQDRRLVDLWFGRHRGRRQLHHQEGSAWPAGPRLRLVPDTGGGEEYSMSAYLRHGDRRSRPRHGRGNWYHRKEVERGDRSFLGCPKIMSPARRPASEPTRSIRAPASPIAAIS